MTEHAPRIPSVLRLLEELKTNREKALRTIQKSREEVAKGEYVECSMEDLEKVLE